MGQKFSRLVVNIEPAICDGHLPFLWERRKRGVRELDVKGDGGSVGQNVYEMGGWVNIEPAICNDHLTHGDGIGEGQGGGDSERWREGRGGGGGW